MRKLLMPLVASLALCGAATALIAGAGAQPARDAGTSAQTRAEHRGQMCENRYARKAGRLAYLEARLNLTSAQAPLFARWKAVSLDTARRHAAACADRPAMGERHSLSDRLTHRETRLKQRLADLQAERPALIALAGSLTPEQQQAFRHGMKGRHHKGHNWGMKGRGWMHRFGHQDRPEAAPL